MNMTHTAHRTIRTQIFGTVLVFTFLGNPAQSGGIITYEFEGIGDRATGGANYAWEFRNGVVGSFSVDLDAMAADQSPDPRGGIYEDVATFLFTGYTGTITDLINGTLTPYSLTLNPTDAKIFDNVDFSYPYGDGFGDGMEIGGLIPIDERPIRGGWVISRLQLLITVAPDTILQNDEMPSNYQLFDDLIEASTFKSFTISFLDCCGNSGSVIYTVTNITRTSPGISDIDDDGVLDSDDFCPETVVPESLPTTYLGVNRFALVDGDNDFDTTSPQGNGPRRTYTTAETAGCSCTQIIEAQGLGAAHTEFGCSLSTMDSWVELVNH